MSATTQGTGKIRLPPIANFARVTVTLAVFAGAWPAPLLAQESQATFFDQEDFNTCAGFLASRDDPDGVAARGYLDWADGYLTAAAEDGRLRRQAGRSGTEAKTVAYLRDFCQEKPLETFYAAVVGLRDAWREPPRP